MRHSQHDDPNLTEVKAVLERLHRISRGQHADDMQTAKKQALPRQFPQAAERLVPEEDPSLSPAIETAAPSDHPNVTKRRLLQAAAAIAVLLIVFGGIARFMALNRQTASVAPPPWGCALRGLGRGHGWRHDSIGLSTSTGTNASRSGDSKVPSRIASGFSANDVWSSAGRSHRVASRGAGRLGGCRLGPGPILRSKLPRCDSGHRRESRCRAGHTLVSDVVRYRRETGLGRG